MTGSSSSRSPLRLVAIAGLVAGTFDIGFACVFWALKAGLPASRIFQSVAAGLLGAASFQGGGRTAALGLALHFFIAGTMALTYYIAASQWPLLIRRPALCGAIYGALLYAFMNLVVLPLSAAASGSQDRLWIALGILVHIALIGVPIGLLSGRAAGLGQAGASRRRDQPVLRRM